MPTRTEILDALHFAHIQSAIPMNTTGNSRLTLTYQFAGNSQPGDSLWNYTGWTAFTTAQKDAVRDALALIETFLNVDFVEVTGNPDPDFNFGRVNMNSAFAGEGGCGVGGSEWDGQVVFNNNTSVFDLTSNYGAHVILHEIGHMLGLDHTFDGAATLPAAYENNHYSLMSYTADPESGDHNDSMMIYDLLALQDIWGAASYNSGNSVYVGRGGYDVRVVWDTGGTDTFDASNYSKNVILDLRPAHFSTFGSYEDVAIAFDVKIEKANGGSGNDRIFGNNWNNTLDGNGGNDQVRGYNGRDTLKGDNGDDKLFGGSGIDRLYGGGGADRVDGGKGDDYLWGRSGSDNFVFAGGYDRDQIRDFANNVDVLTVEGLGTRAQVLAAATEVAGNVKFDFGGGDVLVVKNITLDALDNDLVIV